MDKYQLLGLTLLVFVMSFAFSEADAMGNNEWLDIDMQFVSTNDNLTISCTKDSDVSFNMLMTVINYDTKERLSVIDDSTTIITETITLDGSTIQIFCEYTHNGDKAGYAIMRTFTP